MNDEEKLKKADETSKGAPAVGDELSEVDVEKVAGGMCNPGTRTWLTERDCCISSTDVIA